MILQEYTYIQHTQGHKAPKCFGILKYKYKQVLGFCITDDFARSSMHQKRLNRYRYIHIHNHLTNDLDVKGIVNEFISCNSGEYKYLDN